MTLGIYIQVPFCQTRCTYCNFHTGVVSRDRYQPYANAVCREIEMEVGSFREVEGRGFNPAIDATNERGALAPEAHAPSSGHGFSRAESRVLHERVSTPEATAQIVDTIYFGGGTPSLLASEVLAQILDALHTAFQFTASEITLEADPETITPEKAQSWRSASFNRISLGVQSFHDRELIASGRMHRRDDIYSATKILRAAGLHNISMDLIIGLPHQTADSWRESLTELLALRPTHISIYMLEIDEGSRLGRESLAGGARYGAGAIPPDDMQAEFYDSACTHLAAAAYDHYEISNWALPGMRSRHNLKYWQRAPYLGLGAGAHSFDGRARWANIHDSARYVAAIEQGISP